MRRSLYFLAISSIFTTNSIVFAHPQGKTEASLSSQDDAKLVKDVIQHELDAQAKDQSLWCFHKTEEKNGKPEQTFVACQSKAGEIDRLIAVNGRALDGKQQQEEDRRIEALLKNPAQLRKQKQQQHDDAQQAAKLLKMIPEAFLFTRESNENNCVKLKFTPNPKFRPPDHQAMVFHHMEGTIVLDTKQRRLAEINGRLMDAVKFGGGLLGHLDKGGTFIVRQEEVSPDVWEVKTLDVRMNGKALFFKTIAVREREIDTDFKPLSQGTTIQQAAALTKDGLAREKNVEISAAKK